VATLEPDLARGILESDQPQARRQADGCVSGVIGTWGRIISARDARLSPSPRTMPAQSVA
jgi:hypothetical protein